MITSHRVRRNSSLLLCWMVLLELSVGAQENGADLANLKAEDVPFAVPGELPKARDYRLAREATLAAQVDRELQRLKRATKIGDRAYATLLPKLRPLIAEVIKEHPELTQPRVPPDRILDAIARLAKENVPDPPLLTKYLEDLETRRLFADSMAMQSYVYYVDSLAGLNSNQWEAVRKAGLRLYRQGDLDLNQLRNRDGVPKPDHQELSKILTKTQLGYLRRFARIWRGQQTADEYTKAFRVVADIKVQQLDAEVQLTQSQRKKLDFVARNTIVPAAVERMMTMRNQYLSSRVAFRFADERWSGFVRSTLSQRQAEIWQRFTDRRREAAVDAQAFAMSWPLWRRNLTGAQKFAVHALFRRAVQSQGVKLDRAFVTVANPRIVGEVTTEQDFIAAIGKEKWSQLDDYTREVLTTKSPE